MTDPGPPVVTIHHTRRGPMAHFTADICIGGSLHHYGEWAEDEIAFLRPYIPQGGTVIDVGANVGCHTLAFAEAVGREGRVIAVEADPSTFSLLAHNVVANGLSDRVMALPALAGATPELVLADMGGPDQNVGAKSFFEDVHGRSLHGEAVASMPPRQRKQPVRLAMMMLDDLELAGCNLIKIDVEGMEPDVLGGATETVRRFRPVIYFEQTAERPPLRAARAQLRSQGYRLFVHVASPFNPDNFRGNPQNLFGTIKEVNIAAIPEGAAIPQGLQEID